MFSHLKSSQYENRKDDKHTAETSHLYFCVFVSPTPHPSHHHRQGPCACMCVCEWLTWVPSSLHPSLHPSAASFGGSEQVPWGWCTLLYVCVAATLFSPLTFYGLRKKKKLSLSKRRAEGNILHGRENYNIRQHVYQNMTTFCVLVTDDLSDYNYNFVWQWLILINKFTTVSSDNITLIAMRDEKLLFFVVCLKH